MKLKVRRIGRYWIGTDLLDEGYRPEDIFDIDTPVTELPELMDRDKRNGVRWICCPRCNEISQIGIERPSCELCGWNQNKRKGE
ncbi:MAG TPA: hypothetical protein DCS07_13760 [Bdellovibrionales bacterium]|nr:MAG: hypothetical protein A2Z97_03595 [Bdellovibrionales bacterium GWB1_52_6]OFZ04021.1 MAG: hypothetical protein A2X97_14555 [Bdellovibrionales bacterium GWA1_52_35]OFZ39767.1 MAG: hypothetical protein A2070_01100 [Bdellovibrionales bacterium GWC1_52_8]HAR43675.1 hypothetical protein [Bdellovibrionales bacterium]HCM39894.1 hypothetical protein [Bdellovibrionales bacterium]